MLDGKNLLLKFMELNQLDVTEYIYNFTEYNGLPIYSYINRDGITMITCVRNNLVSMCNLNTKKMKHYLLNQEKELFVQV
ncbi:hypothetical protein GUI51_02870 [Enterococcus mundtii]|uniref:hypothetical protein n=1 Tax=Enterococcus TaxID=1350 RepID=UPI00101E8AB4|nr:hypothetical protein [Enterococcus mundtii]MZZ57820.1 hypothetical protein [Enterococcus mundtii]MZZ60795.1 hypothetical protein [Enterococcus mundtii]MZZ67780.1 hypothetical protein [Enterococcus mundtii]MZZ96631.1 hypothetical protein [Enterococcus mundtii]MZZ99605.1 hypothetical protein [Enterococcus mundtii]